MVSCVGINLILLSLFEWHLWFQMFSEKQFQQTCNPARLSAGVGSNKGSKIALEVEGKDTKFQAWILTTSKYF